MYIYAHVYLCEYVCATMYAYVKVHECAYAKAYVHVNKNAYAYGYVWTPPGIARPFRSAGLGAPAVEPKVGCRNACKV